MLVDSLDDCQYFTMLHLLLYYQSATVIGNTKSHGKIPPWWRLPLVAFNDVMSDILCSHSGPDLTAT